MTVQLLVTFAPHPSLDKTSKDTALRMLKKLQSRTAHSGHTGLAHVFIQSLDLPEQEQRQTAGLIARHINETLDRLNYVSETPDAALSFGDGSPVLIATDASGIDHETLFRLGREVRSQ